MTSSQCEQSIDIIDTLGPAMDCPQDLQLDCGSPPTAATVTATDACEGDRPVSFSEEQIPMGDQLLVIRTWDASDSCGNTSHCTQTIEIEAVGQSPSPYGLTITAIPTQILFPQMSSVDYVKGDLAQVASYGIFESGTLFNAPSLDTGGDLPSSGNGIYYLVRPAFCGSWQNQIGSEPDRDIHLP